MTIVEREIEINGIKLVLGSYACPEAYDAYKNGVQVAYLCLRHGYFGVYCPDYGGETGETVYEAHPNGDGIFETTEREWYLHEATRAINRKLNGDF